MLGIIIITYNALPWIDKSLLPLRNVPKNIKVYIIDNGSTDGTQESIKKNCKKFIFIQNDTNLGFGKANNLGFKLALNDNCTHFLLLNQDAYISYNNIFLLKNIQKENPNYGIISPVHLYSKTTVDFRHLSNLSKGSKEYINDLICKKKIKELYEIKYTNAAIWMISKECLQKVGGFDPLFEHYGEDSEYAKRVNFFSFKVGVAPNLVGFHYRKQNTKFKQNKKYFFNIFLVQLKKMDKNLYIEYLRIFKQLTISSIAKSFAIQGFASRESWAAFFQLIKLHRQIALHKKYNQIKDYYFVK